MKQVVYILSAILLIGFGASAAAPPTVLGDVNSDGAINVLDVQAAIVQALHVVAQTAPADVDGSAEVDITDIQNLINTSLGTGGLVQRIQGTLSATADQLKRGIHLAAVSQDGDQISTVVDAMTGAFALTLPVMKQWSLVFVTEPDTTGNQDSGMVAFPLNGEVSDLLPLTDLSRCSVLDLGSLVFGTKIVAGKDLRELLGSVNIDQFLADANGNQIPDIVDSLLAQVTALPDVGVCSGGISIVPCFHLANLVTLATPCIQGAAEQISSINLISGSTGGVPKFLEPVLACIRDGVVTWLNQSGIPVIPASIELVMNAVNRLVPTWLASLKIPELTDSNGNGIPDCLEAMVARHDLPPNADANGNDIPDFLEPHHHGGEGEGEGEGEVVPSLLGLTLTDARAALTAAGLVLGGIGQKYSDAVEADLVLSQRPDAGKTLPKGAPVGVEISLGQQPQPVSVPNVAGLTEADAVNAITAAGLVVGTTTKRSSATVAEGLVISQLPEAGRQLPPNAPVNLLISSGPAAGGGAGA